MGGDNSDSEEIGVDSTSKRGLTLSVETSASAKKSKVDAECVQVHGVGMDDDSDDESVTEVDPLSNLCLNGIISWTADDAKPAPLLTRLFQSFKEFQDVAPKDCLFNRGSPHENAFLHS